MITHGMKEEQINMWKELSDHASCRKLLGGGTHKVDTQWQSTKMESTRLLISFIKQAVYSSTMDSNMKQSIKSTSDPKDVIQSMQQLKEALDEILAAFKKEAGPQCPAEKPHEKDVDMGGAANFHVEIGDLVSKEQQDLDKDNELPRWVEYLEEVYDKWVKLILNDSSSITVAESLSFACNGV